MTTNQDMIGRDEINDLEAILSVTNTDTDAVMHAVRTDLDAIFTWDYERSRPALIKLYEKAKTSQWNVTTDLDWSTPVDQEQVALNNMAREDVKFFGDDMDLTGTPFAKWTENEWVQLAIEGQNWTLSQFMHGEQGALICTAKIVQTVPDIDSKFYAATQVIDEARHVEVYSRYLHEKVRLVYPLNKHLKALLDDVIEDSRWDMTYLGMQVLIEGLALAAFGIIRNNATDPLAKALNAYVMQDEARHVMFGRLALRDFYPQLTQAERDEREAFCIEACYLMRDRFLGEEVFERLELPPELTTYVDQSETLREFRNFLFMRIVPVLRDIGLWGPTLRSAFEQMGVIGFADSDLDAEMASDEKVADELDEARDARMAHVKAVAEQA